MNLRNCLLGATLLVGLCSDSFADENIGFYYQNNGTSFSYNTSNGNNYGPGPVRHHRAHHRGPGPRYGYNHEPRHPHYFDHGPRRFHEHRHGPWCDYD